MLASQTTRDVRPWGEFEVLYADENQWTKILWIHPGQAISLQKHLHRTEIWVPMTSNLKALIGGETLVLTPWGRYTVEAGTPHSLANTGSYTAALIEIATGQPDENDIIRIADLYGRA